MASLTDITVFLESFAPPQLAEEWDNVGLLVGDADGDVDKLMTCLTITPPVVNEAVVAGVDLIVAHHPLPFKPLKRLTTETTAGRMLLNLAADRIAVYSPHTSFDSAEQGINQRLAAGLELQAIAPIIERLTPGESTAVLGAGRYGSFPAPRPLQDIVERAKQLLSIDGLHLVGDPLQPVQKLAVACGSAGDFLEPARQLGCDCLLTGETRFHTCLEAEANGMGLILVGHYASERFALEYLADILAEQFPAIECWASREERDPLRWL